MGNGKYYFPGLDMLAARIRENCDKHGFVKPDTSNISEKLMLTVDELSEAHEEVRDGKFDEVYYSTQAGYSADRDHGDSKPEGFGVELADAIIRILDICAAFEIDIAKCIDLKMQYNEKRPMKHGRNF